MLKPCPFFIPHIDAPLMKNSRCFFIHKINLLGVKIRANHLFWLLNPNNAPRTAYKIIQYINFSKIHNITKYQVNQCFA